jgi:tRNA (cmo5U34)-methyltransferase
MKRDELFRHGAPRGGDFVFDASVAAVFDDMIARSVPFYDEQQRMLAELVQRFARPGAAVHDLGCATATTLIRLARAFEAGEGHRLVGHDRSEPMLRQARERIDAEGLTQRIELRRADLEDPAQLQLENAGVVLCCWTLQFIRPLQREALVRRVYDALADGGALIVTEKVLSNEPELDREFIDCYYAHKARSGYSATEIHRKREALENVLVPYRIDENRALFRRCGFEPVDTFFQWFNFAGFLCLKPSRGGDAAHVQGRR